MNEIERKELDVNLAVLTNKRIDAFLHVDAQIERGLHHYKAAAGYATKLIEDPNNYYLTSEGVPAWKDGISIFDDHHIMVADGKGYDTIIDGTKVYPAVMYVLAAINNTRNAVRELANEWMTMAEAEFEYDLTPGIIRQYVSRHRERMLAAGHIKQADGRTVLIKRGIVINRWVQRRKDGTLSPTEEEIG